MYRFLFFCLLLSSGHFVSASEISDTVSVGEGPVDIVVTPDGNKLYVTSSLGNSVGVIDTQTYTVVKTIPLTPNGSAHWIAISPNGSEVYVAERISGKVQVISTITDDVVATIYAQSGLLNKISVTPDGSKIYVVSANVRGTIRVAIIDVATRQVVDSINTTDAQNEITFSADGEIGYLQLEVNNSSPLILYTNVIDLDTKITTSVIRETALRKISKSGLVAWGVNYGKNTIDKIDMVSNVVTSSVPVLARPNEIVVDEISNRLFVTNDQSNHITILDLQTLEELERIQVSGSIPAGLSISPDRSKLYVVNAGSNTVDVIQVGEIDPPLENKDMYDLLDELIEVVDGYSFPSEIEQAYFANLKKVEGFLNSAKYTPAENQIRAFLQKLEQDFKLGKITEVQFDALRESASAVLDAIPDDAFGVVSLITQVVSPYPSLEETTSWAGAVYAGGRASTTGDCGLTIAQCGCAISSLSMVGKHHGVDTGFDGTAVNPLNMNNWLLANGGYSHDGSVLWNYALAYMGREKNGKVMSTLSLDGYNETKKETIDTFVAKGNPSLGFSAAKGHYVVLTDVMPDAGYSINDPLWYNTKTTDDTRDVAGKVQDYNNVVSKANLIGYSPTLKSLSESIEIVLESPAELLVIDEKGRRLGYDMATGNFWDEIPGGTYDREDFILNPENPASTPHKAKRIYIAKPEGESFVVKVIGTGDGAYHASFAITDGVGGLFGEQIASTTRVGNVDEFTVTTLAGTGALPLYLQNILNLVPSTEQKKFVQAFTVIAGQIEKDHVIPTEKIVKGLIRFIEEKYAGKAWAREVVAALQAVI